MSGEAAFAGITVEAARRALAVRLRQNNIESPELDARLLIGAALRLDHTALATQAKRVVSENEAHIIAAFGGRRLAREPVARILGHKEFWGLDLRLSDATLVPRPDTETIVEAALDHLKANNIASPRIADIGTGSGAILLALLSELPGATGIGTDISAEALDTAALNAASLGLAQRAALVRCDYAQALTGPFDLIVSNPPYIPSADIAALEPDVREHDPMLALDGGTDGLDAYRAIIPQAAALLVPGGALIVEVGIGQSEDVGTLMQASALTLSGSARTDLGGVHRAVTGLKIKLETGSRP